MINWIILIKENIGKKMLKKFRNQIKIIKGVDPFSLFTFRSFLLPPSPFLLPHCQTTQTRACVRTNTHIHTHIHTDVYMCKWQTNRLIDLPSETSADAAINTFGLAPGGSDLHELVRLEAGDLGLALLDDAALIERSGLHHIDILEDLKRCICTRIYQWRKKKKKKETWEMGTNRTKRQQ